MAWKTPRSITPSSDRQYRGYRRKNRGMEEAAAFAGIEDVDGVEQRADSIEREYAKQIQHRE